MHFPSPSPSPPSPVLACQWASRVRVRCSPARRGVREAAPPAGPPAKGAAPGGAKPPRAAAPATVMAAGARRRSNLDNAALAHLENRGLRRLRLGVGRRWAAATVTAWQRQRPTRDNRDHGPAVPLWRLPGPSQAAGWPRRPLRLIGAS